MWPFPTVNNQRTPESIALLEQKFKPMSDAEKQRQLQQDITTLEESPY